MSTQYPGGFITKSPVAPTTSAASGIWTVDQAMQYTKAGTWPTPPLPGQQAYTTAGTFTWVAPSGITSVSVVCVGGGGGRSGHSGNGAGGGALAYAKKITVT